MIAAWYERQGPAREVSLVGEMLDPVPGRGEVRIRIAASGINPGDIEKRQDAFGYGMTYPRVIPHSDGAGKVDQVGDGVSQRGWDGPCGAMEPSLTVRSELRPSSPWSPWIRLPPCRKTCRWIRARASAFPASPRIALSCCWSCNWTVLVQGTAGSVGLCAVQLARHAGAWLGPCGHQRTKERPEMRALTRWFSAIRNWVTV
jgi:NADPH:quinone reductase